MSADGGRRLRTLVLGATRLALAGLTSIGISLPERAFAQEPDESNEPARAQPTRAPDFYFVEPMISFGLRGGWAFNRSQGQIFDFLTELLTLDRSDFDGPALAIDSSIRLAPRLDAVVGVEVSGSETESEYRDYVDELDLPIRQKTRLIQVPITFSLKVYPIGRGRKIGHYAWVRSTFVPYLGGGLGATWYELVQSGDFVDFQNLGIFTGRFESTGWSFAGHVFLGFDIKLTKHIGLVVESRYYWANAKLGQDFIGFDSIELDGARAMVGFSVIP